MKQKGKGKKNKKNAPVAPIEQHYNMGYQETNFTTLDDFQNAEFESEMHADILQPEYIMTAQKVALENSVVNDRLENNFNSGHRASVAISGKLPRTAGRVSTNTSIGFDCSSKKPAHNAVAAATAVPDQAESGCQEQPRFPQQDPRYNEEELNASLLVIRIIMRSDDAEPFNVPVDPIALGILDYFDVVDKPMDFGTICKNLENGVKYVNSEDVFKDVKLIWENCCKYNKKGNYILELMKRVKKNFLNFWAAAKLYMEQPQGISGEGNSHLQSPSVANAIHSKRPVGLHTDNSSQQLQAQMGPSQVPSHCSMLNDNQKRPPSTSNMRHNKQGQNYLTGSDTDNSTFWLQDLTSPRQVQLHRPSPMNSQSEQRLAASSTRHSVRGQGSLVGLDTNIPAYQLEAQMTLQIQRNSHQPLQYLPLPESSSSEPQASSQPTSKRFSQPQDSPQQPNISSNEPQVLMQQPDTSSSQSQDCPKHPEAVVQYDKASSTKQKNPRSRGPTRCLNLCNRDGTRLRVCTNELGQPIGLEASKLTSFLGTVARDGLMVPLIYADWRAMPDAKKEKMWQQVESKFDINPICKDWVIRSLGNKWRDWKSRLKTARYDTHETDEERLADRDERVPPDQWATLVSYWSSAEGEARSAQNKANRSQQKFGHATGTKSFARIREEERSKRADGKELTQSELFVLTRTRKDGRPVNEASAEVISQLQEYTNQQQDISDNGLGNQDDMLCEIMGRDKRGRLRSRGLSFSTSSASVPITMHTEALRMVAEANSEVREMKERMATMEQTCAQMATQMSTMMVMMSSMQKSPNNDQSDVAADKSGTPEMLRNQLVTVEIPGTSEGVQQLKVSSSASRSSVPPREKRASKRIKMQKESTATKECMNKPDIRN